MTTLRAGGEGVGVLEHVVEQHGGRAAILDETGGTALDYRTLDREVRQLAGALRLRGVTRGGRVIVWADKGPRYVEAILATLYVGAGYVPLDGGQPAARVATVIRDAEPTVLVTDSHRLKELGTPGTGLTVILCDDEAAQAANISSWVTCLSSAPTDHVCIDEDDLVALLYTSGSSGTPKGVQITQRNLLSFISWARNELDVDEHDVFANHASFNFDLSTFDLFVALSVGAALWIVPGEQAADIAALNRGIRTHAITVLYCVPSVLRLLTDAGELTPDVVASLRYVLFAGEHYPTPLLREFARHLRPDVRLYNLYGPTETNVCTFHEVRPDDLVGDSPVPIGRALPGAHLHVVDDAGIETGTGIGELVVSGPCVTPGYWRRPAESAAAGHPDGRHATGDLVSRRPDGQFVYRGRRDRMVKLAGRRVELGEVEAVAVRHPHVTEAAAVVLDDPSGPRLALFYCVPDGSPVPSLLELKRHCADHLPAYMLPRVATRLDSLPRNPNGKTDYRHLSGSTL